MVGEYLTTKVVNTFLYTIQNIFTTFVVVMYIVTRHLTTYSSGYRPSHERPTAFKRWGVSF